MLALISAILGLLSSLVPNVVKLMELKTYLNHEYRLYMAQITAQMKTEATDVDNVTLTREGDSLRSHDTLLTSGSTMESLRASIRPVITYVFFFLFIVVKASAATLMFKAGNDPIDILNAVWDQYTMSLFSAIMGFWFGARTIEKMSDTFGSTPKYSLVIKKQRKANGTTTIT